MMARYRRNRRKALRGGNKPEFAEGGARKLPNTQFEHHEPPSAQEAVRQQQAGSQNDAEMQMAMNQTGGGDEQEGGDKLTVPQSGAASPEGNDAMAQSAGMLMQSRQNEPAGGEKTSVKGGARRKTRRKKRKRRKRTKKKKKKKKKRKTKRKLKNKYKFARKYHQKGCSRKRC